MNLRLKEAPNNPRFVWLCEIDGNLGDPEAQALYGDDRKLAAIAKSDLTSQRVDLRNTSPIVVALKIESGNATTAGDWQTFAAWVEGKNGDNAAQAYGYDNLEHMLRTPLGK